MGFNIFIDYPAWFILICLAIGFIYSFLLYLRNKKEELSSLVNWLLGISRFLVVSAIVFLLLSPMFRSVARTDEKPVVIIVQDNSESIIQNSDSSYYRNEFPVDLDILSDKLNSDFETSKYYFGTDLKPVSEDFERSIMFSEEVSDLSNVFKELEARYANRNVGAIILSTDGIYNKGINPLYADGASLYPVYCIALGDTSYRKDASISKVNYNRIAYLDNEFPMEVHIKAHKLKGQRAKLEIIHNGEVQFSKYIDFTSDHFVQSVLLQLEAGETGLQRYRVQLQVLEDEVVKGNNFRDVYLEILDSRKKILILYDAPHPDIAAIRHGLESNIHYEVSVIKADDFFENINSYNLVILHQVPSKQPAHIRLISELEKSNIPRLYILGVNSSLTSLNALEKSVSILSQAQGFNEVLPVSNKDFSFFELSEDTWKTLHLFPPLLAPFGEYQISPNVETLLYQKIGSVQSQYPLICFIENLEYRSGFILGEGIWKWRLTDYRINENHDAFNELISKTMQLLSATDSKKYFRVTGKNSFMENESVEFEAEVYTKTYDLINTPDIEMEIMDQDSGKYVYNFNRREKAYFLNAGNFIPGKYHYSARVAVGDDTYDEEGEFSVEPVELEVVDIVANHNLLYNIAFNSGGELFYPQDMEFVIDRLRAREDIKTIVYEEKKYEKANNIIWILIGIILLLSIEWFVRRFMGSY